jgi:hypothetical protein
MKITVEVREDAFRTPKTRQQIEEDIRQAAAMFWLARGDIAPEHAQTVTAPAPAAETEPPGRVRTLHDLVLLGPDVGEDADFERPRQPAREQPEWDP